MNVRDRVKLVLFNGSRVAPNGTLEHEDYWKLLDSVGIVLCIDPTKGDKVASEFARVLVKFDQDLTSMQLENHNEIVNSLWIAISDLKRA